MRWLFIFHHGWRNLQESLLRYQLISIRPWRHATGTSYVDSLESRLPLSSMWMILLGAHARMCFKSRKKADCLKYLDIYSAIEKGQVPSRAGSHFTLFFCVEMKALRPHKVVKYKKKMTWSFFALQSLVAVSSSLQAVHRWTLSYHKPGCLMPKHHICHNMWRWNWTLQDVFWVQHEKLTQEGK